LCAERAHGPLSLGLLVSGLRQRLHFQDRHQQLVMLDAADDAALQVVADHLAAGIDPARVTVFAPQQVPELAALRAQLAAHAPEAVRGTAAVLAALQPGFVSPQAADAIVVADANRVIRAINQRAGSDLLTEARPLLAGRSPFAMPRAPLDVPFSADADTLAAAIDAIPPGAALGLPAKETEGHPLFQLLDVFERDIHFLDDLKSKFRRGGLSERVIRAHLIDRAEQALAPLRERRAELLADRAALTRVLDEGAEQVRTSAAAALARLAVLN
jgi:tryptophanyl-tRNA synthetase